MRGVIHNFSYMISPLFTDRDECANKPCKNGTCIDKIASYQCKCNTGYTGKDCETGNLAAGMLTMYHAPLHILANQSKSYFLGNNYVKMQTVVLERISAFLQH